jgi:hypothetical protein
MRAKQFTRKVFEAMGDGDVANAVVAEVIKLIGEGHTEVSPDVITTKVSAALGRPFMLKDLVAANNSSPELQHYIDSINPSKIKFSTDILTVKNQDPVKTKEKAQSGVANMASRAASRPRLGESVSEGWNTGSDRVSLPDTPHTYWSGTGPLQKEYDALYNELVPSQGKADTIEGEVLRASSKIVYRHYNDGDEFNRASYRQLEPYIGPVTSYDDLAHKAIEFAVKANGNYTPNPDWDSLDVMDYGPAEDDYEDDDDEDDDYDDWSDDVDNEEDDEVDEGMEEFAKSQAKQRAAKRKSIPWPKEVPSDASQEQDDEDEPHPYGHDLDEGAADVYSITSERNGRERTKSGTLAELIEYYGYTLETGKSYEHERGNRKINLNPKSIESLVQNLNNAKSNAAANGQSSEHFYVDHGNMAEGRGPSKGLHKKVTIVKGRDAGKTGYVRQIKTDKLRNRVYLDLDLEDGGQAVVLKQDVRLVKEVDEARTTWNNDFYVYDPKTKTVKKKFRTHKGAKQYAEANGLKVASAEYYHDSVSKEVDEGMEEFAKAQAKKRADARKEKSQPKEGWGGSPGAPDDRPRVERDPDAEYDAMRTAKADDEMMAQQAKRPQTKVYSLSGRGPNQEPNYEFPGEYATQDEADKARARLMADPKTPNPRDIGIRSRTKYLDENSVTPLRDLEDYQAKKKALQDIQTDPDTSKDPELSLAVMRRLAGLEKQRSELK